MDTKEQIDDRIEYIRETMPAEIKKAILRLNADLYNGPLYFNADDEECTCFDEGKTAFDFSKNAQVVRAWIAKNIEDVEVEVSFDEETEESQYERVEGSAREIARAILGKELNATI